MTVTEDQVRDLLPAAAGLRVQLTPHRYATSAAVHAVVVGTAGAALHLVAKDLAWEALGEPARRVKPRFLHDPAREVGVYRHVLPLAPEGPPHCWAAVADGATRTGVLLLEQVRGRELYQVGELRTWCRAARWLAALHAALAPHAEALGRQVPLLRHDRPYLERWLRRARERVDDRRMDRVAAGYARACERLLALPRTVVHGEAYASNLLVDGRRVCAVDWEMAAVGPGLLDLAALTSGPGWGAEERAALTAAYLGRPAGPDVLADLDACRLQLAVQWLGWSRDWQPPPEHAHDWLGEAVALSDRLVEG